MSKVDGPLIVRLQMFKCNFFFFFFWSAAHLVTYINGPHFRWTDSNDRVYLFDQPCSDQPTSAAFLSRPTTKLRPDVVEVNDVFGAIRSELWVQTPHRFSCPVFGPDPEWNQILQAKLITPDHDSEVKGQPVSFETFTACLASLSLSDSELI